MRKHSLNSKYSKKNSKPTGKRIHNNSNHNPRRIPPILQNPVVTARTRTSLRNRPLPHSRMHYNSKQCSRLRRRRCPREPA